MLKRNHSKPNKKNAVTRETEMQNGMQNITRYNKEWYEP